MEFSQNTNGDNIVSVVGEVIDLSTISETSLPICGESLPVTDALQQPLGDLCALTSIADVVHTVAPGESYRIITDHKDVWLSQRDPVTGKFPSLPRGEKGRILEHPQWKRVGVDAVKAVKVIGSQMMLVHISMQLQQISTRIEHLVDTLHNNNVATLEGCVQSLRAGIRLADQESKKQRFENVANDLHQAIEPNIRMLQQEISDCPKAKTGFWDAWGSDGLDHARRKMARAQDTARILFQGIAALYYAYIARPTPEYDVADEEVHKIICKMFSSVDFGEAHEKNALASGGGNGKYLPTFFWRDFSNDANHFLKVVSGKKEVELIVPNYALLVYCPINNIK